MTSFVRRFVIITDYSLHSVIRLGDNTSFLWWADKMEILMTEFWVYKPQWPVDDDVRPGCCAVSNLFA